MTEPMEKIAATERSNPPAMITSVIADAMIASGAFWLRMFSRLRGVRKFSDSMLSAMTRNTIMIRTA